MQTKPIDTIVFDLGGVLISWNPRNLYRKIFTDEAEMEYFLANICTMEWNEQQDAGRSWKDAINLLLPQFPAYEMQIRAYRARWPEMLNGSIQGTVDILTKLHRDKRYRLYALTNWSAETFPIALDLFPFLQYFEGIIVSGDEKLKKPDPKIYQILHTRYNIKLEHAIFTDDSLRNIKGAASVGLNAIHFQSPEQLAADLRKMGIVF